MAYRDRLDIVRNLLEGANNNKNDDDDDDIKPLDRNYMSKTRLGFTASLTHTQTTAYLDELLDRGLIVETETDFKPHPYYEITERGRRCLELFGKIADDLKPLD
ncbi:MAG: winged helix-turn-helix domain-containing protein [Nitrososphaeraceae archaeon]